MNSRRTKFYRDKHNAKWMGVCAGIADYTGIETVWIRVAAVMLTFMTGGWTIPAYFAVGLLADKKPVDLYLDRDEQKFWQKVRQSPSRTARDVKGKFREIDRRIADVELYYTSRNSRLADEIEKLR